MGGSCVTFGVDKKDWGGPCDTFGVDDVPFAAAFALAAAAAADAMVVQNDMNEMRVARGAFFLSS